MIYPACCFDALRHVYSEKDFENHIVTGSFAALSDQMDNRTDRADNLRTGRLVTDLRSGKYVLLFDYRQMERTPDIHHNWKFDLRSIVFQCCARSNY